MGVGYETWLARKGNLAETEAFWEKLDRTALIASIMEHEPQTVIEFCCGTGWIPYGLPFGVHYIGIDANAGCINLAEEKNPTRVFLHQDMRQFTYGETSDLALAFSCLKHFTLEDWDSVYGKVLQAGRKTLATVYLRPKDVEEPQHPYIHTAVTLAHMERVIKENGHRLVKVFTLPPLNTMKEPLVLTERVDAELEREGLGY